MRPSATLTARLLHGSAQRGARVVARAHLAALRRAARRLRGDDDEALHELRVALRRLRNWLRAFRPRLEDTVRRRVVRRLRSLASATNEARDLQVTRALLAEVMDVLALPERTLVEAVTAELTAREASAGRRVRRVVTDRLPKTARRLDEALDHYWQRVEVRRRRARPARQRMDAAMMEAVERHLAALDRALAAISGPDDVDAIHDARIAGKRLRYLLEPLRPVIADAGAAVEALVELQDSLGGIRDLHLVGAVVADAAGGGGTTDDPAYRTLMAAVRERELALYARAHAEWLGTEVAGRLAALVAPVVEGLRAAVAAPADAADR